MGKSSTPEPQRAGKGQAAIAASIAGGGVGDCGKQARRMRSASISTVSIGTCLVMLSSSSSRCSSGVREVLKSKVSVAFIYPMGNKI
jgi:hypothetical protein